MNGLRRLIFLLTLLFPSAALAQIREEYRPLSELLATRPERVATEGNRVEVIPSGSELFFRMQEDIMGATQTIHASFFIFHNDEAGFVIRSAFQLQALDSLEVQYIAEDFIQKSRFIRPMKKAGVKVGHQLFFPLIPRNHQKYLLLDGTLAYAGGCNIARNNLLEWEDMAVRLRGPVVAQMEQLHARNWKRTDGSPSAREPKETESYAGGVIVQPVDEDPAEKSHLNLQAYIWALDHAKEYFYAKTPYFLPPSSLVKALSDAARRGVDVRLVIPRHKDARVALITLFEGTYFKNLLAAGVHIHLRESLFDHSKVFSCDHYLSAVGSVNLDALSLLYNYENNLFFYDEGISTQIKRLIEEDFSDCEELHLEGARHGIIR